MNLSDELRDTIIRRVQQASVTEILSITGALCANGADRAPTPARADGPRFQLDSATVLDTTTGLRWTRETVAGGSRVGSRTYLYDDKSANLPPWAAEYVVRIDAEPEPWSELKASRALELLYAQP